MLGLAPRRTLERPYFCFCRAAGEVFLAVACRYDIEACLQRIVRMAFPVGDTAVLDVNLRFPVVPDSFPCFSWYSLNCVDLADRGAARKKWIGRLRCAVAGVPRPGRIGGSIAGYHTGIRIVVRRGLHLPYVEQGDDSNQR